MADRWEWLVGGALAVVTRVASADHGGATSPGPSPGLGLGWLLVVGAVLALALGAWAMFAPDRQGEEREPRPAKRS